MKYLKEIIFAPHPPVVIPEIGKGREYEIKSTVRALEKVAKTVRDIEPDTIICITPHGNIFSDGICILDIKNLSGDLGIFGREDLKMEKEIDQQTLSVLKDIIVENKYPHIFMNNILSKKYNVKLSLDHGAFVPFYYIDKEYSKYKIIHVTIGLLPLIDIYRFGILLKQAIEKSKKNTIILASGDLSHCLLENSPYEYNPLGSEFDEKVVKAIKEEKYKELIKLDPKLCKESKECGLKSFVMALGAVDAIKAHSEILCYEGPFGVGYMTGLLNVKNQKKPSIYEELVKEQEQKYNMTINQEDDYIKIARKAMNNWITQNKRLNWNKYKRVIKNEIVKQRLDNRKAGVFVSIYREGNLRGCIGTIQPTKQNIAEEIIYNSIQACCQDHRFLPVAEHELKSLVVKVDVLGNIEAIDTKDQLDVKKYGVVVQAGFKRGLLLPNIEGVDTVEEQIDIAKNKADIKTDEVVKLFRFEVERHEIDF